LGIRDRPVSARFFLSEKQGLFGVRRIGDTVNP